jgi:hypothetical protein
MPRQAWTDYSTFCCTQQNVARKNIIPTLTQWRAYSMSQIFVDVVIYAKLWLKDFTAGRAMTDDQKPSGTRSYDEAEQTGKISHRSTYNKDQLPRWVKTKRPDLMSVGKIQNTLTSRAFLNEPASDRNPAITLADLNPTIRNQSVTWPLSSAWDECEWAWRMGGSLRKLWKPGSLNCSWRKRKLNPQQRRNTVGKKRQWTPIIPSLQLVGLQSTPKRTYWRKGWGKKPGVRARQKRRRVLAEFQDWLKGTLIFWWSIWINMFRRE